MWHKPQLLNALADLLFAAAAAALVVACAVWAVRMPSLPIRQVVVTQELKEVRRGEVELALAGMLRGNFFSVNLEAIRASLESLPWVRKAEVRRQWPAQLQVTIEEHKPVARWDDGRNAGRNELVNSYGELFIAWLPEKAASELPILHGPQGTAPEVLKRYAGFVGTLQPVGLKPTQLTLSPRLAWQMKFADGMVMNLGREQNKAPLESRLARFVEVYPVMLGKSPAPPAVVDLRYPNGFAVRIRG
mgnify:CR=1 FL=1